MQGKFLTEKIAKIMQNKVVLSTGIILLYIIAIKINFINPATYRILFYQFLVFILMIVILFIYTFLLDCKKGIVILEKNIFKKNEEIKWFLFFVLLLLLYSFDQLSWKYIGINDQYYLLNLAKDFVAGNKALSLFKTEDVNNSVLSHLAIIYTSLIMFLSDRGLWGWKLSSAIITPLMTIPFYIWLKMVFNRKLAIIATVCFAFSQSMLAGSHIGYNNIQAIPFFILSLLFIELSLRKKSAFWTTATAVILGLGCFTVCLANVLIVVVGIYYFFHPNRRNNLKQNLIIGLIIYISFIILKILNFNCSTCFYQQIFSQSNYMQYIKNFVGVFFSFVFTPHWSHYLCGRMVDIITAIGVIIGLLWLGFYFKKDWRAKFLATTYVVLVFFIAIISQDKQTINSNLFFLTPVISVLAAIGWNKTVVILLNKKINLYKIQKKLLVIFVGIIVSINMYKFYVYMPQHFPFSIETEIMKTIQQNSKEKKVFLVDKKNRSKDIIKELLNNKYYDEHSNRYHKIRTEDLEKKLKKEELKNQILVFTAEAISSNKVLESFLRKNSKVRKTHNTYIFVCDFTQRKLYNDFQNIYLAEEKTVDILEKKYKLSYFDKIKPAKTVWDARGNIILDKDDIVIINCGNLEMNEEKRWLDISLESTSSYTIIFKQDEKQIGKIKLGPKKVGNYCLARYSAKLPEEVYTKKFNKIVIMPRFGYERYSIGHVFLRKETWIGQPIKIDLKQVSKFKEEGTSWNAAGNIILNNHDLIVDCKDMSGSNSWLDISLDNNDKYLIAFIKAEKKIHSVKLGPKKVAGLAHYNFEIPKEIRRKKFDTILVNPIEGDGKYSIGHLILNKEKYTKPKLECNWRRLSKIKPEGTSWNASGNIILNNHDLMVDCSGISGDNSWLDVSLDNNDKYSLEFIRKGKSVGKMLIGPKHEARGLARYSVRIPEYICKKKFDKIIVRPLSGDGMYSIGHLVIKNISDI